MREIWKDVKGYETCYLISNLGNIISLGRSVKNNYNSYFKPTQYLKPVFKKNRVKNNGEVTGYYTVVLYDASGKRVGKQHHIHRLVAEHFVDGYEDGYEVDHVDGNKLNNNYTNLEWVSSSENRQRSYDLGLVTEIVVAGEIRKYDKETKTFKAD